MQTLIKKLPLVGFILAIMAAFAFNSNSTTAVVADHYFEWSGGSNVSDYISSDIEATCPEPAGNECALGFDEQYVDTSVNPPQLMEPAASDPLTYAEEQRFKE